jgi:hypothetical protein
MKSLFLKIFLWFWTAFVIVGVTLVVVVAVTRSNTTMLAGLSVYLPFEARQATDIYEHDGKSALQRHFDHLSEMGLAQPYLLDENGNDVLGRRPPAQAVEFAKAARSDTALVRKFKGWKAVAAQQVVGEGGHKYTIMAIMSRPPVVGVVRDLGYKTLLGLLTVLLVGAPFCFLLACHIANPIVRLSEAAGRIADGWLDTRSGQNIRLRGDEIGRLGVSFDRMAERIE